MTSLHTIATALPKAVFWHGSFQAASGHNRSVLSGRSAASRVGNRDAAFAPDFLRDKLAVVSFIDANETIFRVVRTGEPDRLARLLRTVSQGRVVFSATETDPTSDNPQAPRSFGRDLLEADAAEHVFSSQADVAKGPLATSNYPAPAPPEPPPG